MSDFDDLKETEEKNQGNILGDVLLALLSVLNFSWLWIREEKDDNE